MANRTALEILNAIEDELGLNRTVGVGSQALNTRQVRAYVNATIEEAVEFGTWSALEKEAVIEIGSPSTLSAAFSANDNTVTVASTAGLSTAFAVSGVGMQPGTRIASVVDGTTLRITRNATQAGPQDLTFVRDTFNLPDDFNLWIPQTHWDSRMMWQLIGPTNAQFDAWQRNGIVGPYPRRQFRRVGPAPTAFRVFPPPTASADYPGTLVYYYETINAVDTAGGVGKRFFDTENDDVCRIPDRVLILGAKWRWQQAKGFDFGPLQQEYYNWFDAMQVTDRGQVIVDAAGGAYDESWLDRYHVPDGNYPGPSS